MAIKRLTSRDDFGFVDRRDESTACAGALKVYCPVIDDASVYYKTVSQKIQDENYQRMWDDAVGFRDLPTGRIPAFYRALYIQKRFVNLAGRMPTVGEMASILATVDGAARNGARVDDAWSTDTLIRAMLGLPLDADQQAFIYQQTGKKQDEKKDDKGTSSGGGSGPIIAGVAALAVILLLRGRG